MSYNSKRTGAEVEALLDKAGTALQSIPSEYVTDTKLSAKNYATTADLASGLSGKVDNVSGKQLSTEDFTTALKNKLNGLSNYDDTVINSAILSLQNQINTLTSGNASAAIESFNEIIAFLDGISDSQDLDSIISSIEQQIAAKYSKPSTGIPKSDLASSVQASLGKADTALQSEQYKGTYSKPSTGIPKSDLDSSVQSSLNKADSALQSYTEKYTGTYSKPSTGIPKTDLASEVQASLGKADTALQSFTESDPVFKASAAAGIKSSDITNWNNKTSNTGTVTGVKMNGTTKSPSSGIVDLGTVITAHQDISGKVDKVSGKQLSTNDYTTTEKNKLAGIASGAEVNVQSDWNVTDSSSDAFIKNKPSIPSAVTESTVSGWGFTKNTGTYSKPSTGIPKTDLSSAVQTSLGKADTALQSYTEKYTGTYSKPSTGIPKSDLASAVQTSLGKADTALQSYTEKYTGTITGITMNGASKGTSGVVNLGTVITAHQDISGKLDKTTAESTYAKKISTGSASAASASINPNHLYVWGTMTSLTIALATPADSTIYNEYMFQFTSGSTATTLSVPSTVKWVSEPNIEANKTYQVSIVNNIGIIVGV